MRALRVTFVGELGWELYCSSEYGAALWRTLAGDRGGAPAATGRSTACGWRRATGCGARDLSPDVTPYEAGLGFCVGRTNRAVSSARTALAEARERGLTRRLRCLTLDDPRAVCLGSEPVRVGGEIVGRVTSGGFGHTVGRSIAYAYLPVTAGEIGAKVEVGVFGEWVTAEVVREPLYDPLGERVRG